jgi:two-component system, chemotaxis family, chemotaxis protein CheY
MSQNSVSALSSARFASASELPDTILLVDDDPEIRSLTRTFLEHENYRVLACGDADRAAKVFSTAPHVDLLITDLYMPDRSGIDLAHQLKATRKDLPILVISGGIIDAAQQALLQRQGWTFLPKPFSLPQLLSAVHVILSALHPTLSSLTNLIPR